MHRLFLWLLLVISLPFSVSAVGAVSPKIPMVAVMPFSGRALDGDAPETIASALGSNLLNTGKFRVMERSQMDAILKEQGFQQSGACDGSECAVEVGKLLSVDHMVVGTVGKVGGTYVVTTRLVSVQTGEVLKSVTKTSKAEVDAIVTNLLPQLALDLSVRESASVAAAPAVPVAPAPVEAAAVAPPAVSSPSDNSSASAASTPSSSGPGRRSHWGWWLAGGAVVAGGATAAVLLMSNSSGSSSTSGGGASSSVSSQKIHVVQP